MNMGATNLYNEYMKKKSVLPTSNVNSVASTNTNNLNLKSQIVNNNSKTSKTTATPGQVNPNSISGVNTPNNANPNMGNAITPPVSPPKAPPIPGNVNTLGNNPDMLKNAPTPFSAGAMGSNARGVITDKYKPTLDEMKNQNIEQAKKEYDSAYEQLRNEYENSKKEFEFGKNEVNKGFTTSKENLDDNLYNQHQQLNINATNRGISYSPQALGLEQVNNVNYNKNVTKIMEQKNDLLSEIDMKIANLSGTMASSLGNLQTSHLGNLNSVNQQYMNQLMELMMKDDDRDWSKEQTTSDRNWQQTQTEQDKAWQKEWAQYQQELNKQMSEFDHNLNKKSKGGSGGYSGGGYRGSYSPSGGYNKNYSSGYSKSYGSDWSNGGKGSSYKGYDGSEEMAMAGLGELKNASNDIYNSFVKEGGINFENIDDLSVQYDDAMSDYMNSLKGMPQEYIDEANATARTTKQKLLDRAYSNSTNTPFKEYDEGSGVMVTKTPSTPLRKEAILRNQLSGDVRKELAKGNALGDFNANRLDRLSSFHESVLSGPNKNFFIKDPEVAKQDLASKQTKMSKNNFVPSVNNANNAKKKLESKIVKNNNSKKPTPKKETIKNKTTKKETPKNKSVQKKVVLNKKALKTSAKNAKKNTVKKTVTKLTTNVKKAVNKIFKKKK